VASTQSGGAWLRVVPPGTLNTGATALVQVGVDMTGLAAGVYSGAITFAVPGTSFSRAVPVTLTVSGATPPPAAPSITAVPAALAFTYRAGDALPDARVLQVAGTAGLPFTAAASSDADWLAVSPASASIAPTTSLTVSVAAKAAALAAGPHSGSIVLSGGSSGPSVSVPVSLSVSAPLPAITGVVNAASYAAGAIAAGEIVTIFGQRLGPAEGQGLTLDADGNVAKGAGGVQVLVGGFAAPVLYASERQVSAVVPYEIASPFVVQPAIVVKYGGQTSNGFPSTQVSAAPALFTADSSGAGHAAALNGDFSPNSAARPAAPGDVVQLFVTGEGQTSPGGVSGKVTTVASQGPLTPQPLLRVAVTIDGLPAKVLFYGEAPGIVAGMMQMNVEVPAGARVGEAPVVMTLGSGSDAHETQAGVTVWVR
jgi:uncharacterized protein (TIGR03437 family)